MLPVLHLSVVLSVLQLVSNRCRIALIGLTLIRFRDKDIGVLTDVILIYISCFFFFKEYLFHLIRLFV